MSSLSSAAASSWFTCRTIKQGELWESFGQRAILARRTQYIWQAPDWARRFAWDVAKASLPCSRSLAHFAPIAAPRVLRLPLPTRKCGRVSCRVSLGTNGVQRSFGFTTPNLVRGAIQYFYPGSSQLGNLGGGGYKGMRQRKEAGSFAAAVLCALCCAPVTTPFELSLSSSTLPAHGPRRICARQNRPAAALHAIFHTKSGLRMSAGEEGAKQNPVRGTVKLDVDPIVGTQVVDLRNPGSATLIGDVASTSSEPEFRSFNLKTPRLVCALAVLVIVCSMRCARPAICCNPVHQAIACCSAHKGDSSR